MTNISFETLKKHELMRCMGLTLHWKEGQPDTVDRSGIGDVGIQQNLSGFEKWLKELTEFRDEILKINSSSDEKKSR